MKSKEKHMKTKEKLMKTDENPGKMLKKTLKTKN